jgi:hypothetical protein
MRRIADYEVENIGPEHSQYFQGRGVSLTNYDEVAIGIGENAKEAYEDAVEGLAHEWDVSRLPNRPRGIRQSDRLGAEELAAEEMHWHVAIYVRESRRETPRATTEEGGR